MAFNVWKMTLTNCASTTQGANDEVFLALNKANTSLVASDVTNGTVDQFLYASCSGGVGSMTYQYPAGTPSDTIIGVAFDPGVKP
jgi:hypothetical protein